jgi:hypothetical protein
MCLLKYPWAEKRGLFLSGSWSFLVGSCVRLGCGWHLALRFAFALFVGVGSLAFCVLLICCERWLVVAYRFGPRIFLFPMLLLPCVLVFGGRQFGFLRA